MRCGVAPIKIETGRYEGFAVENRVCPFCRNCVEDEIHVMLACPVYQTIRLNLCLKASEIDPTFASMSNIEKFICIFSNKDLIKVCAKTCYDILQFRNSLLYR